MHARNTQGYLAIGTDSDSRAASNITCCTGLSGKRLLNATLGSQLVVVMRMALGIGHECRFNATPLMAAVGTIPTLISRVRFVSGTRKKPTG